MNYDLDSTKDGQWQCNNCGMRDGVVNGVCPKCGPTQTTPTDDIAMVIAGVKTPEQAGLI